MAAPTYSDLGALLGRDVTADQGGAVLAVVTSMANAYTRGNGFTDGVPNDDIRSVILTAAARLLAHTRQVEVYEVHGPDSARFGATPFTWSVSERETLNRYRVRAQ